MQNNILQKIALVSLEMPAMKKTTAGYNYKYFDINQMLEVMKPILDKHGLAVLQPMVHVDGKPAIQTIVVDKETGDSQSWTTMLLDLPDAQKMGGCVTYFRRYALQALFSLEAEDDDANHASDKPHTPFAGNTPPVPINKLPQ